MNRSDLIHKVSKKVSHLKKTDVIEATFLLTDLISNTLYKKDRVEIIVPIIKKNMIDVSTSEHHKLSIPLTVDVNSGNNWDEAH